ncbi:MAG TPA: O-antigen ligase family protein [Jatrophihabitantaceae bacterium]|jgi:O-antigen ligase
MTAVAASTQSTRIDAVTGLTAFVVMLVVIPSDLIFGPLGSAGTPAEVLGMGLFATWLIAAVSNLGRHRRVAEPIRTFAWLFVGAVLVSYVAANSRAMFGAEARAADAGLLMACSWMGVLLLTMDRVPTRERLDVLLRRLVLLAGALATLGLLQFATKMPFTNYLQVPGLATNQSLVSLYGRNGLTRPAGTAVHPIEFGAVLTMALPIALHYAMIDRHRPPLHRWYPVLAIGFAVPISISRSAVLSLIVVLCFVLPTWARAARRRAYAAILALFGAVYVMVPGLLGTITHLFTGVSNDSSAKSRSGSFSIAYDFISRTPVFGRGFLTFLPAYRILDDQYLGLLIETGVVGLAAYLGLLVSAVVGGLRLRRTANRIDSMLGVSLAASAASALASFALFDAFSFPMAASLIFLILGCVGALRRFARTPSADIRKETPLPA